MGIQGADKNRNDVILEKVGVVSMEDKMREVTLRWFGDLKRRYSEAFDRSRLKSIRER